jgi:hypothetical protein
MHSETGAAFLQQGDELLLTHMVASSSHRVLSPQEASSSRTIIGLVMPACASHAGRPFGCQTAAGTLGCFLPGEPGRDLNRLSKGRAVRWAAVHLDPGPDFVA